MTEKRRRIYIRTDGNGQIGMGHIVRCLSIGMALRDEGGEVCFILADGGAVSVIEKAGFPCEVLGTDYRRMEEEIPTLERLLSREKRKKPEADAQAVAESCLFLVDSYSVTDSYLRALGRWGKVAYMDDVNAFSSPVDAVINGNIYGAGMDYSAWGAHTEILGGPAFAPLRPEFEAHRGERREEYILVTTGGGDPYHLSEKIVRRLLKESWTEREKICVVCGSFSQSAPVLREMEKEDVRLRVLQDVPDMWNVMNGAKLAITAAGSTMQELA
ncbi:MAG: hypothetical protein LUE87_06905, partial [Lachnospiraceae bacterium]|nr:hypothetical protein [Lachnospiraceae bacterium]